VGAPRCQHKDPRGPSSPVGGWLPSHATCGRTAVRETLDSLEDGAWPDAGPDSPRLSSGDDAPLHVGRRAAGCRSCLDEGLRGLKANPSASDRRAAQGVSKFIGDPLAPGVAALRAGPPAGAAFGACPGRRAQGLHRGCQRPPWPGPGSAPASGSGRAAAICRRSGRRSGRIGFLKRVDDQIATQSAIHFDPRREYYCSREYLGYVLAFTC
jgi:hypothetical protein